MIAMIISLERSRRVQIADLTMYDNNALWHIVFEFLRRALFGRTFLIEKSLRINWLVAISRPPVSLTSLLVADALTVIFYLRLFDCPPSRRNSEALRS